MTTRKLLTVALSLFITLAAVSTVSAKGNTEFTTSAIKKGKVLESSEHDSTKKSLVLCGATSAEPDGSLL